MKRKNIYMHNIDLIKLSIKNRPSKEFAELIEDIPYRGYNVEAISDGRNIAIVKPGGKQSFGKIRKEDFFVFIYNKEEKSLWQISHKQIFDDLNEKASSDKKQTVSLLEALERVYNGEDPDDILNNYNFTFSVGESPEALLKAYKWIWGQEDVNYPTGKGRAMSWEGWEKIEGNMEKNGNGLKDLLKRLKYEK